jgi:hypothetical protein
VRILGPAISLNGLGRDNFVDDVETNQRIQESGSGGVPQASKENEQIT